VSEQTQPDAQTRAADRQSGNVPHQADRPATAAEEADAPETVGPGTAEHEQEMAGRGAHQEGEGRIP
jgi:hypothetical protein